MKFFIGLPFVLLLAGVAPTSQAVAHPPAAKQPRARMTTTTRRARPLPLPASPYRLGVGTASAPSATLAVPTDTLNSFFGQSVAGIGDVNGDGFADALVGAYGAAACQGKVYLYLGSKAGLAATPSGILANPAAAHNDYFGGSITGVGDVNRDGYGDVVIGAAGASGQQGKAYLYLGGRAGLSSLPSATLPDPAATSGDRFGSSLAKLGDVNGDGYADVLVGTRPNIAQPSHAYLYLGGRTGLEPAPTTTFQDPTAHRGSSFGSCVAGAGDVNGDGYADVLIGAPNGAASRGRAYLYLGSRMGVAITPARTLEAADAVVGDLFGYCVAGAGDTNGDGYADVLIGAYGSAGYQGRTYVYLGSATGLAEAATTLAAPVACKGDYFGALVTGLGDLNQDGYADALVGSNGAGHDQGKAYVYLGTATGLPPAPAFELSNPAATEFDLFGTSGTALGDVNGDGAADLMLGAYGTDFGRGKAYVYLGVGSHTAPAGGRPALSLAADEESTWQVTAYPNPYVAGLTAQLTTPEAGLATLTLVDAAGRVVLHHQQRLVVGSQVLTLENMSALPAGHYTLLVRQSKHTGTVRLVHQ